MGNSQRQPAPDANGDRFPFPLEADADGAAGRLAGAPYGPPTAPVNHTVHRLSHRLWKAERQPAETRRRLGTACVDNLDLE